MGETCLRCGEGLHLEYECDYCGGTYCVDHRRPEDHGCPGADGAPKRDVNDGSRLDGITGLFDDE